ncbi:MAG: prenyltransferase/squalene oxidase repeat-containing protein [Lentisphaeria bacterium]
MDKVTEYYQDWSTELLAARTPEGVWQGELASSAVSTATAVVALHCLDPLHYQDLIRKGRHWLMATQLQNGGWGDTPESPANRTASLLAYAAIFQDTELKSVRQKAEAFLTENFSSVLPEQLRAGILQKYGSDRTFAVPILALCATVGLLGDSDQAWRDIPRLPFELAILPGGLLRFLQLQVVSYAIPALICVGIAQHRKNPSLLLGWLREGLIGRSLRVLHAKQPHSGGFLEAAPLTAFCLICLSAAGLTQDPTVLAGANFLCATVRSDGSWPIDSNLDQWLTSLAGKAVIESLSEDEKAVLAEQVLSRQFKAVHPFTGARPGGWGWTPLSGAVPEADDSSAALILLHSLCGGTICPEIERGCRWLLEIQNRDGGIPTFCRGWGRLPFDHSSPDISAHAYRALSLWMPELPEALQIETRQALQKILRYLEAQQDPDGAFLPLWFGDQQAPDLQAPVYGTAVVLENLQGMTLPWLLNARDFLLEQQLASGAWGCMASQCPKVIFTARAIAALAPFPEARQALQRGLAFLQAYLEGRRALPAEPVGLYFSQLWYSEKLYPEIFLVQALDCLKTHCTD